MVTQSTALHTERCLTYISYPHSHTAVPFKGYIQSVLTQIAESVEITD